MFGLLEAPHRGWADPLVLICLVGGILLAALFVFVELRSASPLFDVRLLGNRAFGSGSLSVAVQFLASFGMFYLVLQLLQLVFGYSPLQSAVALMPFVAGVGVFSLLSNWVAVRLDSLKFVIAAGALLSGAGLIALGLIPVDNYWTLAAILAVIAIGIGLATAPATTAIMSNTPAGQSGRRVRDQRHRPRDRSGHRHRDRRVHGRRRIRVADRPPTADLAREQLTAAGQQQIAAGDPPTGGQATIAQAEQAGTLIERSLAEATIVVDKLSAQSAELAQKIADGSKAAFDAPMEQASLILGGIMLVSSAVLFWLTPRRVVEGPPVIIERTGDRGPDPDVDDTFARD